MVETSYDLFVIGSKKTTNCIFNASLANFMIFDALMEGFQAKQDLLKVMKKFVWLVITLCFINFTSKIYISCIVKINYVIVQ